MPFIHGRREAETFLLAETRLEQLRGTVLQDEASASISLFQLISPY
jgi:hypothetical protein